MKKFTSLYITILCTLLVIVFFGNTAMANHNVTFKVRMAIQMQQGWFLPGSGDIVKIAGNFDNWGSSTDTLKNTTPDSIYTATVSVPDGALQWKYMKTLRNGTDWEANQPTGSTNREVTISVDTVFSAVWFSDDSVYVPPAPINVTFNCNMKNMLAETAFAPDSGDVVIVTGSMNGWPTGGNVARNLTDPDHDSIYSITLPLQKNTGYDFKYWKSNRYNLNWENNSNRHVNVTETDTTLQYTWFNNDSLFHAPAHGNWLYNSDMTVIEQLGYFDRTALPPDSLFVSGGFNGWTDGPGNQSTMNRNPGTETYELNLPFADFINNPVYYKYYMKFDTTRAVANFPKFLSSFPANTNSIHTYSYEHPYLMGDGNRIWLNQNGDNSTPVYYFNDIHQDGLIPAGDTIWTTFQVDMHAAMSYVDAFVPANDTLTLLFEDSPWLIKQGYADEATGIKLTDPDGDGIYTATIPVKGPATYGLLYRYRYIHAGGANVDETSGLADTYKYRTRFIRPPFRNGQKYTMPVDIWQHDPPFPHESLPFSNLSGSPAVTTLPVTNNADTTVSISTLIDQNDPGNTGHTFMQWGATTAYGTLTSNVSLSTGTISASLAHLAPGVYHFRGNTDNASAVPGLDQAFRVMTTISKWNLLSLPAVPANNAKTALFPVGAPNPAYIYGGSYTTAANITAGEGFWLKFNAPTNVAVNGTTSGTVTVPVKAGWNIIGGPLGDVTTSSITAAPQSMSRSQYFAYTSTGYHAVTTLTGGTGYWVKASVDGNLVLTSTGGVNAPKAGPDPLTKMNAINITDAAGNTQTLYFGRNVADLNTAQYEVPPTPPAGVFDARFSSGKMLEVVDNGKSQSFPISIVGAQLPVTISWDVKSANVNATLNLGGDNNVIVEGKGYTRINSTSGLNLKVVGAALPTQFSLMQNYPNPFNPTTNIKYGLPEDSHVKLTVYNLIGQEVVTLVNEVQKAGYQTVEFNATNLTSGVYFYRIEAGKFNAVKKLVLVK